MNAEYDLVPYEEAAGGLMDRPEGGLVSETLANGGTMMQTKTSYTTAVTVQKERDLPTVQKRILVEAQLMGEAAYYGWGSGKDRVDGPSQALAYAVARNWGNCALEMSPVQETADAWIFTAIFIDLETGFTLPRQFRQSKKSIIYGKFDDERKDAMRFAIGQSKSQRNVILKGVPRWMIDQAIVKAKEGVRAKLANYIKAHGIQAAIEVCLKELSKHGVKETQICEKFGVAKSTALTVDDLVVVRGDISALQQGQESVETLYPQEDKSAKVTGMLCGNGHDKPNANGNGSAKPVVDAASKESAAEPTQTDTQPESAHEPHTQESNGFDGTAYTNTFLEQIPNTIRTKARKEAQDNLAQYKDRLSESQYAAIVAAMKAANWLVD